MTVVESENVAASAADAAAAARKPGEAGRRAEREKHERYPGPQLTAFVVELAGDSEERPDSGCDSRYWSCLRT